MCGILLANDFNLLSDYRTLDETVENVDWEEEEKKKKDREEEEKKKKKRRREQEEGEDGKVEKDRKSVV